MQHSLATFSQTTTGNGNQDIEQKKPQEINKILVILLTLSNSVFMLEYKPYPSNPFPLLGDDKQEHDKCGLTTLTLFLKKAILASSGIERNLSQTFLI